MPPTALSLVQRVKAIVLIHTGTFSDTEDITESANATSISMRNDWVSHASPKVFQTACILSSYMIQEDQGGYRQARNTGLLEIVLVSANCRKTTHPGWGLTRVGVHGDAVTVDFAITKYDGLVRASRSKPTNGALTSTRF